MFSRALQLEPNPFLPSLPSHLVVLQDAGERGNSSVASSLSSAGLPRTQRDEDMLERVQQRASQVMESLRELGLFIWRRAVSGGSCPCVKIADRVNVGEFLVAFSGRTNGHGHK